MATKSELEAQGFLTNGDIWQKPFKRLPDEEIAFLKAQGFAVISDDQHTLVAGHKGNADIILAKAPSLRRYELDMAEKSDPMAIINKVVAAQKPKESNLAPSTWDGEISPDEIKNARAFFAEYAKGTLQRPQVDAAMRAMGSDAANLAVRYTVEFNQSLDPNKPLSANEFVALAQAKSAEINARPLDASDPAVSKTLEAMKNDYMLQAKDFKAARDAAPSFVMEMSKRSQLALPKEELSAANLQAYQDLIAKIGKDAAILVSAYVQEDFKPAALERNKALKAVEEKLKAGQEVDPQTLQQVSAEAVNQRVSDEIHARPLSRQGDKSAQKAAEALRGLMMKDMQSPPSGSGATQALPKDPAKRSF